MKNLICSIVLIIGTTAVVSCQKTPQDYYPLNIGSVYKYKGRLDFKKTSDNESHDFNQIVTIMEQTKLDDRDVILTKHEIQGDKSFNLDYYVRKEKDGYFYYAQKTQDKDKPTVFKSQQYILKVPIQLGTSWENESMITFVKANYPITLKTTIVDDKETITVPAGNFYNCLKVESKGFTEKSQLLVGTVKFIREDICWYAPGIGLIKSVSREECSIDDIGSKIISTELVSYEKP